MTLATLLLSLALASPTEIRAVSDTVRAPKPPPLAPTTQRRKPEPPPLVKPAPRPKGKPVGEPQLKRRKPPGLDFIRIR